MITTFLPWSIQHPIVFEANIASTLLALGPDAPIERLAVARKLRNSSLEKLILRLSDPKQAIDDVTLLVVLTLRQVDVR